MKPIRYRLKSECRSADDILTWIGIVAMSLASIALVGIMTASMI